jgi:tRNA U34 5-carboxymethylaminomethyl modifying GTPase MnmE/TrmE
MSTSLSSSILRSREVDFLTQERRLAQELGDCLRAFESSAEDNETLRLVTQSLQEPFLLVIAGEFNAGKSAFINALVGEQALTEGVTKSVPDHHLRVTSDATTRLTSSAAIPT